jgi:DNA-binding MarR family transcriptional regulator
MAEPGGKIAAESNGVRRRRSGSATHSPLAANSLSPVGDSLRPVTGVDYGLLLELAGFWLRRVNVNVLKSYDTHLAELQLRPVETAALILLKNNRDLTQNALASALSTDQSTMVGISTRLEESGLIGRRRHSNDRRYQILSLTPAGRKTTALVEKRLRKHNENILRRLTQEERRSFFKLLTKIID